MIKNAAIQIQRKESGGEGVYHYAFSLSCAAFIHSQFKAYLW